jgi:hypothetical protein
MFALLLGLAAANLGAEPGRLAGRVTLEGGASSRVVVAALRNRVVSGLVQAVTKAELYAAIGARGSSGGGGGGGGGGGYSDGVVVAARTMVSVSAAGGSAAFLLGDSGSGGGGSLLAGASYSVFAFADDSGDGDGAWDPASFERCGWWNGANASVASTDGHWLLPVNATAAAAVAPPPPPLLHVTVKLALPLPLPAPDSVLRAPNGHGSLRRVRGQAVLSLSGSAAQRGAAHGYLLGGAILSFFRHFTLAETTASGADYEARVLPFVRAAYDWRAAAEGGHMGEYWEEATALVGAMGGKAAAVAAAAVSGGSGATSLQWLPELGRNFSVWDLLYLNDYGSFPENGHAVDPGAGQGQQQQGQPPPPPPPPPRRACTQFAFWGADTAGTDVDGGTVVGRNMDGENDVRRLTVSHLLLHAVAPAPVLDGGGHGNSSSSSSSSSSSAKATPLSRYVHAFWPGFLGAASGLNERGIHCMMNDGQGHPEAGDAAAGLTQGVWTQRELLARAASLADVAPLIAARAGDRGGTFGSDANLMLAEPSKNVTRTRTRTSAREEEEDEKGEEGDDAPHALVYEGDRLGGALRLPGEYPWPPRGIMVSNHFHKYGYDGLAPLQNFGYRVYFSSLWRYEAGQNLVQAWSDTAMAGQGQQGGGGGGDSGGGGGGAGGAFGIGTAQMVRLLQTVTHASTEHSLITRPDAMEIDLAVASAVAGGWHAPYLRWTTFQFEELFDPSLL